MQKLVRRCLALFLAALFAVTCSIPVFAANTNTAVQLDVTYQQTDARGMLQLVNDFRASDQAWYWNEDDQTKTDLSGKLQPFTYDYKLEQVAMQRAAEIILHYSHTRPDNTRCYTAYTEQGVTYSSAAENIAIGYTSAQAVFKAWREDAEMYEGQGHRRNMLSNNRSIGIAHVEYEGMNFWVQEFGTLYTPSTTETTPNNSETTVTIHVASELIQDVTITPVDALSLSVGDQVSLPTVNATLTTTETWAYTPDVNVTLSPTWSVTSGNAVEVLENGKLAARSAGSATLSASILGQTVTCSVTVTGATSFIVTLDQNSYPYTGKPITPNVTVTWGEITLTEGVDYTVTYANNIQVGTATLTVTGKGNYTGAVTKEFTITPCQHQWDDGEITTPATCTTEGVRTYTCQLCGETKTEAVAKLPHTPVTDPAVPATCTNTGLTEGSHCSVCHQVIVAQTELPKLPHNYVASVTTPATCTEEGVRTYTCSMCSHSYTEAIPATGHSFGPWTPVSSPSCDQSGSEKRTCSTCGFTENRGIDPTGHDWETEYTVDKAPTCTQEGSKSIHCTRCDAVTDVQSIPATGHTWDEGTMVTPATCTEEGTMRYTCSVCQQSHDGPIPATGHTWDEGTVITPATCTEEGTIRYTCSVCQETHDEPIPATGHTWDEGTVITPATCTEEGSIRYSCSVCDEPRVEAIPATGHHYEDGVCTVCGAEDPNYTPPEQGVVLVNNSKVPISVSNAQDVFAPNTVITVDPIETGDIYARVEQSLKKLVSDMSHVTILEFTATRDGKPVQPTRAMQVTFQIPANLSADNLKMFYVAEDGSRENIPITINRDANTVTANLSHFSTYVLANVVTDAGSSSVPPTGDNSNLALYGVVLVVCVCALATVTVVVIRRRQR